MTDATAQPVQLLLEFSDTYSPLTDTVEKTANLILSPEQIRTGLMTELSVTGRGARNFAVLLAIASFMDAEQKAFPSQKILCEITGLSRPTLKAAIDELCAVKVRGQQLLECKKVPSTQGHFKTVYKIAAVADYAVEQPTVESEPTVEVQEKMTAKDVLVLFMELYEQEFGIAYVPAWGRDVKLIKEKLLTAFTDDVLKEVVTIAVTQYTKKWANRQYPYPTVGQLTSWLANAAAQTVMTQQKEQQQFDDRVKAAEAVEQIDSLALLDL